MSLLWLILTAFIPGPYVAAADTFSPRGDGSARAPLTPPRARTSSAPIDYRTRLGAALSEALERLTRPQRPGRVHYYEHGVFYTRAFDCWRCDIAPGLLAADLGYAFPSQRSYRGVAIATFNALIRNHTLADGSFGPSEPGETGHLITTEEVCQDLGVAYLALRPWLSPETRRRWVSALLRAGRSIEPQLVYYVNGNINLGETLAMYLVYRATRDQAFLAAYNQSYHFTLYPPRQRWPGFGLRFLKSSKRAAAGYLGEAETGAPGFDPHYTIVQSEIAATLYAVSHQPRTLRLLSLLTNALLTRTNRRTDFITTTGGSRRPAPSQSYLESPCLPVLAFAAGRSDLLTLVRAQLAEISLSFPAYAVRPTDQNGEMGPFANVLLVLPPAR